MKLIYEIEYQIVNGKLVFDPFIMTEETELLKVEFNAQPRWENDGIGSYEYWGQESFDKGTDYVSLEYHGDPTWDKSMHSEMENNIIEAFRKSDFHEKLCDLFCDTYEKTKNDVRHDR